MTITLDNPDITNSKATLVDSTRDPSWRTYPIEVNGDEFTFNSSRMEKGRFYHFVWEKLDYFAFTENGEDVDFFVLDRKNIGNLNGG